MAKQICKCGGRLHHEEKPGAHGKRYHYETCQSCGRQYLEVRNANGLLLQWIPRRVKVEIPKRTQDLKAEFV